MASVVKIQTSGKASSWVVVDQSGIPVPLVTRYLNFLVSIEKSPNTVRNYASDLKNYFSYLEENELQWNGITAESLGYFIAYLRQEKVAVGGRHVGEVVRKSPASVNRNMAAVGSFYKWVFHATGDRTFERLSAAAGKKYRPTVSLVDGIGSAGRLQMNVVGTRIPHGSQPQRVLSQDELSKILQACQNRRERLLILMLHGTGMRISQLLNLRHEDVKVPEETILVIRGDNRTAVHRNKSISHASVPVTQTLIRAYLDYMWEDYGYIDSDYVFINLWGGNVGAPMTYSNVAAMIKRLCKRAGVSNCTAHTFRHTYATNLLSSGVSMEVVSHLLTHKSVQVTIDTYAHLNVAHTRQALIDAGVWER